MMTLEEQRIAVAEECGICGIRMSDSWEVTDPPQSEFVLVGIDKTTGSVVSIDDYPNDLNAMAEAEKVLTPAERALYGEIIAQFLSYYEDYYSGWNVGPLDFYALATSTSQQRCEAFLRTRGKWKE